jgi:hypothetical protein
MGALASPGFAPEQEGLNIMSIADQRRISRSGIETDRLAVRLPEAIRISGFSRSELYRRAARGEIIFLKCGSTTLVDVPSLRAAVGALPRAVIRTA